MSSCSITGVGQMEREWEEWGGERVEIKSGRGRRSKEMRRDERDREGGGCACEVTGEGKGQEKRGEEEKERKRRRSARSTIIPLGWSSRIA